MRWNRVLCAPARSFSSINTVKPVTEKSSADAIIKRTSPNIPKNLSGSVSNILHQVISLREAVNSREFSVSDANLFFSEWHKLIPKYCDALLKSGSNADCIAFCTEYCRILVSSQSSNFSLDHLCRFVDEFSPRFTELPLHSQIAFFRASAALHYSSGATQPFRDALVSSWTPSSPLLSAALDLSNADKLYLLSLLISHPQIPIRPSLLSPFIQMEIDPITFVKTESDSILGLILLSSLAPTALPPSSLFRISDTIKEHFNLDNSDSAEAAAALHRAIARGFLPPAGLPALAIAATTPKLPPPVGYRPNRSPLLIASLSHLVHALTSPSSPSTPSRCVRGLQVALPQIHKAALRISSSSSSPSSTDTFNSALETLTALVEEVVSSPPFRDALNNPPVNPKTPQVDPVPLSPLVKRVFLDAIAATPTPAPHQVLLANAILQEERASLSSSTQTKDDDQMNVLSPFCQSLEAVLPEKTIHAMQVASLSQRITLLDRAIKARTASPKIVTWTLDACPVTATKAHCHMNQLALVLESASRVIPLAHSSNMALSRLATLLVENASDDKLEHVILGLLILLRYNSNDLNNNTVRRGVTKIVQGADDFQWNAVDRLRVTEIFMRLMTHSDTAMSKIVDDQVSCGMTKSFDGNTTNSKTKSFRVVCEERTNRAWLALQETWRVEHVASPYGSMLEKESSRIMDELMQCGSVGSIFVNAKSETGDVAVITVKDEEDTLNVSIDSRLVEELQDNRKFRLDGEIEVNESESMKKNGNNDSTRSSDISNKNSDDKSSDSKSSAVVKNMNDPQIIFDSSISDVSELTDGVVVTQNGQIKVVSGQSRLRGQLVVSQGVPRVFFVSWKRMQAIGAGSAVAEAFSINQALSELINEKARQAPGGEHTQSRSERVIDW